MSEYIAEDYINFIELGRFDKISNYGLDMIAKKFRSLEDDVVELKEEVQGFIEEQAGADL